MGKYDPLTAFLSGLNGRTVRLTFAEIEKVIGQPLPSKSKVVRAWWSNNPDNNVMTRAWLASGYRTAQVDIGNETLTFEPNVARGFGEMQQSEFKSASEENAPVPAASKKPGRHPTFGVWKGLVKLDPDYDYTKPADPEWGKVYED